MPKKLKDDKNNLEDNFEDKSFQFLRELFRRDDFLIARKPIKWGFISLGIFFFIFLFWAVFAPIKSAAIAEGTIVLDFNKKTIQHFEGGIIDAMDVKEGQIVKKGDILLYLRDIKAKSDQTIIKKRLWSMSVQRERLLSQKDGYKKFNLDNFFDKIKDFIKSDQAELVEVLNNQISLFQANEEKYYGEIKVLNDKLTSNKVLRISSATKLSILRKQLKMIKPLVEENNLPLIKQYDLEKEISDLEGSYAQYLSEERSAKRQIANYKNQDLSEIYDQLKEIELEIVSLSNQLESAQDIVARSEIISPVSGKIMNVKYHTIGAVVPPGGEIMDIVPQNDELIIEAKVKPQNIDEVHQGLMAKVMLVAYKGKKVPKLNARLINISPDIFIDEQRGESYFLARIRIEDDRVAKLKNSIELYPGMPVQVFITTGSRSLLSYLFAPIQDAAYKAFREE